MKMNSTYIRENGLLEDYLLGELNDNERQAVSDVLKNDQSLRDELRKMELDLENLAFENAVEPPAYIKTDILDSIVQSELAKDEPKVLSIRAKTFSRRPFYAAASVAALLLIGSIYMYTNWQDSQKRLQTLEIQSQDLKEQLAEINSELEETRTWYSVINDAEVKKYILRGNLKSPQSVAIAYVDDADKRIVLKADGLQKLDGSKTYQMWADVDGEMIDMGVIPSGKDMVELTYIENAESLNITIEPEGGNDHPTVEQLITNVIL